MAQQVSIVDLARLSLSFGEATSLPVPVRTMPLELAGQTYTSGADAVDARLDVSRTKAGYALRLRFPVHLQGPCHRCLEDAGLELEIDSREVDQTGAEDEELQSPYVQGDELDVSRWAQDAVALALPARILCRADCAGLCAVCGISLNDADPDEHRHEQGGDPRWAKLRELPLE
jgi:DUF177 domain-containing protein